MTSYDEWKTRDPDADFLGPDPDELWKETCDHCHGEFDPLELKRVVSDYLCPDCFAAYVTSDEAAFFDETLADMLSYRARVL